MPTPTIKTLMDEVSDSIATRRRIHYVLESERFQKTYGKACETCRIDVVKVIKGADEAALESWINEQAAPDYGQMGSAALRIVARKFRISNYQRLSKALLLSEIINHEKGSHRRIESEGVSDREPHMPSPEAEKAYC